jgi:hypothetical protein
VQDPSSCLLRVDYFTAPIKARLATHGEDAVRAQDAYHRALTARGRVEIIAGWYSLEGVWAPRRVEPPNKADRVAIWKLEEKETDVHLALRMYRDAIRGECEQVVLVSSDSDLVPALKMLAQDVPAVRRGLVLPRAEALPGAERRPANKALSDLAHWTRREIKTVELAASQLPARVPTRKRPIDKPAYW